ncbi:hypothetical protein P5V63_03210 [Mycobacteroides abscessus subsp. abscessus]|uniref:hypothetical protein n=1 Tax=Mycobacteroides abscessus TaxID=36809 RepID=UPI0010426AD9|nr:hypothetical protein [Mycobacteroides abscessus]MDO3092009.1 hypothetical protein [Mycobacteroides abscessus subsp. abscessus]
MSIPKAALSMFRREIRPSYSEHDLEQVRDEYNLPLGAVLDHTGRARLPDRRIRQRALRRLAHSERAAQLRADARRDVMWEAKRLAMMALLLAIMAACVTVIPNVLTGNLDLGVLAVFRWLQGRLGAAELLTFMGACLAAVLTLAGNTPGPGKPPPVLVELAQWLAIISIDMLVLYCLGGKDRSIPSLLSGTVLAVAVLVAAAVYIQRDVVTDDDRLRLSMRRLKIIIAYRGQLRDRGVPAQPPDPSLRRCQATGAIAVLAATAASVAAIGSVAAVLHPHRNVAKYALACGLVALVTLLFAFFWGALMAQLLREHWSKPDVRTDRTSYLYLILPMLLLTAVLAAIAALLMQRDGVWAAIVLTGFVSGPLTVATTTRLSRTSSCPCWASRSAWAFTWETVWRRVNEEFELSRDRAADNVMQGCPTTSPINRAIGKIRNRWHDRNLN